jgi:hypothetical protein
VYFEILGVLTVLLCYRDKKVGVFVRFRAPLFKNVLPADLV